VGAPPKIFARLTTDGVRVYFQPRRPVSAATVARREPEAPPRSACRETRPRSHHAIDAATFWSSIAICQIQANTLQFFLAMHDFPHQTDIFDSVFAGRPRTPARGTVFWGWR